MESLNLRMRELDRLCYAIPQDVCKLFGHEQGHIRRIRSWDVWQVEFDMHGPRCRRMTIYGRLVSRIQFGETQVQFKTAHHAWSVIRKQAKLILEKSND